MVMVLHGGLLMIDRVLLLHLVVCRALFFVGRLVVVFLLSSRVIEHAARLERIRVLRLLMLCPLTLDLALLLTMKLIHTVSVLDVLRVALRARSLQVLVIQEIVNTKSFCKVFFECARNELFHGLVN